MRELVEAEDHPHHPRHLILVGVAVAADRLLDPRRRVLDAVNAGGRRGDEDGAARLPDGERDAGVGADVRLLQGDGIRAVLLDQLPHPLEDREQPQLHAVPRLCSPPPVAEFPEAPVAFVDDPVPARSRPWIDAEDFHPERLRTTPDVPAALGLAPPAARCETAAVPKTKPKAPREHWQDLPEEHDFAAAANYLSLTHSEPAATAIADTLRSAITIHRQAKDLLRAARLELLPVTDPEVKKDLKKVARGEKLSPVLLVRGTPLLIADGYHRICASYHVTEDAEIPCRLVDPP